MMIQWDFYQWAPVGFHPTGTYGTPNGIPFQRGQPLWVPFQCDQRGIGDKSHWVPLNGVYGEPHGIYGGTPWGLWGNPVGFMGEPHGESHGV